MLIGTLHKKKQQQQQQLVFLSEGTMVHCSVCAAEMFNNSCLSAASR